MINVFVLCKNDIFFRTIEQELNRHNIFYLDIQKDPETALQHYEALQQKTDILLLDANWKKYVTADAALVSKFRGASQPPKIILVTNFFDELIMTRLDDMGAHGYFYRNVNDLTTIIDCITSVYSGKKCIVPKL